MTLAAAPVSPEDPVNRTILAVSEDRIQGFRRYPFQQIAEQSGVPVDTVLERIRAMLEAGTIRRVRQTLLSTSLARGALVAWSVPPARLDAAFQEMFENGDQAKIRTEGFSLLDIKRFLERRGFIADGYELPLQKLVETNTPAIVLISESGYHHFVVVKGLKNDRVLIGDPATGTRPVPLKSFEAKWEDQVLFVIHNKPGVGIFNDPVDWRVAPPAPLYTGVNRDGLFFTVMPKHGASDF